jgi:hypothetical protein
VVGEAGEESNNVVFRGNTFKCTEKTSEGLKPTNEMMNGKMTYRERRTKVK